MESSVEKLNPPIFWDELVLSIRFHRTVIDWESVYNENNVSVYVLILIARCMYVPGAPLINMDQL